MKQTMAAAFVGTVLAVLVTVALVRAVDSASEPVGRPLYNYGSR